MILSVIQGEKNEGWAVAQLKSTLDTGKSGEIESSLLSGCGKDSTSTPRTESRVQDNSSDLPVGHKPCQQ